MYQIGKFKEFKEIVHGFSTKADGNMSFLYGSKKTVLQNRLKFLETLKIDSNNCVVLTVLHGKKIKNVLSKDIPCGFYNFDSSIKADGLITNKNNVFLFLLIADCLPIILYDKKRKVISLVHAGWKNIDKNITSLAVKKMKNIYSSNPEDILIFIGPSIRRKSYIFKSVNQEGSLRWKPFIKKFSPNSYSVDLVGFVKKQLIDSGISTNNIFVSVIDTAKSKNYYSFYQDKKNFKRQGRFACIVGLRS